MTELATAYISIVPDTSQIPRQVNQAMGVAGRDAERQGRDAGKKFSTGFAATLKTAGALGGVAAIGGAMKSAISTGMDFTNSLNTMGAVSGASAQQIAAVSAEARRLGTDNSLAATSSVDAAQAMLELAKGGLSVDQSMRAARGTLQLAAAAQIGAAEAAVIQSNALQAFGKDASYAGKTADILANAANQSSAEITDVAFALQAGGAVANQFGMSMSDTAATVALLANAGIKGSDAGTLLKSTLLALTGTTEKQNAAAEQLGLTIGAQGVEFNGMHDLFQKLGTAQKRMTREQYNAAASVLFGSDAMRLAGIAGTQGADGFDRMASAMNKGGAAADVAKAKMAGLPGAWEQLKNSAQDAGLAFYDAVEGPLTKAAKVGADAIGGLVNKTKEAAPVAKELMSQYSGVAAPIGALSGVVRDHTGTILALAVAYGGLKVARTMSESLTAGFNNVRAGAVAADGATGRFTRTMQSIGGAGGAATNAAGSVRGFGQAFSQSVQWMRQANPQMSATAASFAVLRQNGMNASGGMNVLKAAGGGLMGMMGGPLGIALAAGGVALGMYAQHQADAAQKAAEHKQQVDALSQSINFNTGALSAQGRAQVANELTDKGVFKDAVQSGAGVSKAQVQQAAEGQQPALEAVNAALDAQVVKSAESSKWWGAWKGELESAGISLTDFTAALRGNETQQARVNKALGDADMDYDSMAKDLDAQAQAAIRVGKAIGESGDKVGAAKDKARDMAEALGLVAQRLGDLSERFKGQGKGFSIDVDTQQIAGAEDVLQKLGFSLQSLANGQVKITANTDDAAAKLQWVTQNVAVLNAIKANPKIDLDKASFDAKNGEARSILQGLDQASVSPKAGLVIDKLLQGKAVSMQELQTLSQTTANPKVDMEIAKLMEKLGIANKGLDDTAKKRVAQIEVQIADGTYGRGLGVLRSQGNADGSIRRYMHGGINALEQYANGKLPDQALIQKAQPGGGLVQWAEPETDGEAFIPLATGKRGRSTSILQTVAQMFGYSLVPQEKFVDGGMRGVSADDFRRLAEGQGVSRPLEGAPYVWGGINWGDCSGAMSPFARLAAGLPILGGRFATASMAQQLQSMGAKMGRGPSGSMRFGWLNGGPGGGHTAGTLPDGTNVEMGGARGNGQLGGGAAGADDPQFTDHAYFEVGPSWSDPGSDHGGMVQRPDGTWVPAGNGDYSSSSSSSGVGSGKDTISGRFGAAIGSFFEGQLADIFETFGASDKPGWMQAIAAYENSQRSGSSSSSGGGTKLSKEQRESLKMEFDQSKQSLRQDYEADKLKRKQEYELSRQKLEDEYTAKRINKAEYERRLNALKQQHDKDNLAKKQDYDRKVDDAKAKYDSARGKSSESGLNGKQGYESGSLAEKQRYENTKLAEEQKYDAERASRKAQYDADMDSLQAQRKSKAIDKDQYKARSEALKAKYDNDLAGMKTRYENAELQRKQEYDRQSLSSRRRYDDLSSAQRSGVRDPGMSRPQAGQDMGLASTGNPVKDAFRSGMRPAWQDGQPWTDTDWIVGKESSWNPTARNPSGAFGLAQFLGTTKDKYLPDENPDPRVQGTAYDRYVGDRYQTPMGARKHWEANNWYDQGGSAVGTGLMAKNVLAPERVLSPRQTEAFEQMVRHNFNGGTASLEAKLDEMIGLLGAGVGRTTNVTVKDMGGYWDRERQLQRTGIARHRGGR